MLKAAEGRNDGFSVALQFRVFGVQGFRVLGLRVLGFRAQAVGFRDSLNLGLRFRIVGCGFSRRFKATALGVGFRIWGVGFRGFWALNPSIRGDIMLCDTRVAKGRQPIRKVTRGKPTDAYRRMFSAHAHPTP